MSIFTVPVSTAQKRLWHHYYILAYTFFSGPPKLKEIDSENTISFSDGQQKKERHFQTACMPQKMSKLLDNLKKKCTFVESIFVKTKLVSAPTPYENIQNTMIVIDYSYYNEICNDSDFLTSGRINYGKSYIASLSRKRIPRRRRAEKLSSGLFVHARESISILL